MEITQMDRVRFQVILAFLVLMVMKSVISLSTVLYHLMMSSSFNSIFKNKQTTCDIFWLHSVKLHQNFILVVLHSFFCDPILSKAWKWINMPRAPLYVMYKF